MSELEHEPVMQKLFLQNCILLCFILFYFLFYFYFFLFLSGFLSFLIYHDLSLPFKTTQRDTFTNHTDTILYLAFFPP